MPAPEQPAAGGDAPFTQLESLFARVRVLPDAQRERVARTLLEMLDECDKAKMQGRPAKLQGEAVGGAPRRRRLPWGMLLFAAAFLATAGYLTSVIRSLGTAGRGEGFDIRNAIDRAPLPVGRLLNELGVLARRNPTTQDFRDYVVSQQQQLQFNEQCVLYLAWSEETLNEDTPEAARRDALNRLFVEAGKQGCLKVPAAPSAPVKKRR